MTNRFEYKVCIVTGAAAGTGREIARGLLAEGATVIANDISQDRLAEYKDTAAAHPVAGGYALYSGFAPPKIPARPGRRGANTRTCVTR